jgi:kynurenine formamidase
MTLDHRHHQATERRGVRIHALAQRRAGGQQPDTQRRLATVVASQVLDDVEVALALDQPAHTAAHAAAAGQTREGHRAGRDIGGRHIEKMHNLAARLADGFFIRCFPHRIRGASAGWTRSMAIFVDALMR